MGDVLIAFIPCESASTMAYSAVNICQSTYVDDQEVLALLNPGDGMILEVVQLKVELPLHAPDRRGKVADVLRDLLDVDVFLDAVAE